MAIVTSGLDTLVQKIYAASMNSALWKEVVDDLAKVTSSANFYILGMFDGRISSRGVSSDIPIEEMLYIAEDVHRNVPDLAETLATRFADGELFEFGRAANGPFERSPLSKYTHKYMNARDAICGFALSSAGVRISLCFNKARYEGKYSSDEIEIINYIYPNIVSALKLSRYMESNNIIISSALEHLAGVHQAIIYLDQSLRVAYANDAANRLLGDPAGPLSVQYDRLKPAAGASADVHDFCDAVAALCDQGEPLFRSMRIARDDSRRPLTALMYALKRDQFFPNPTGPVAMIVLNDPEQARRRTEEWLQADWRLTPSEARVAIALADGKGIAGTAARLGIARETLRTHLKRIFVKTGVASQVELAAFLQSMDERR